MSDRGRQPIGRRSFADGFVLRGMGAAMWPAQMAVRIAVVVLLMGSIPSEVAAAEEESALAEPGGVVDAYHAALHSGDKVRTLSLLSPRLIVFEDGRSEGSRGEYASHHLQADIEFSRHTDRTVLKRWEKTGEAQAWVVSWVAVKGTARGAPVDRKLLETILLAREGGAWRIAHIHWSDARH